jgi:hypothetical protein
MDAPDRSYALRQPQDPEQLAPRHASGAVLPHGGAPPAELVEQIAARLRPVCAHLDPALFDALVLDVARFTLRWGAVRRPLP